MKVHKNSFNGEYLTNILGFVFKLLVYVSEGKPNDFNQITIAKCLPNYNSYVFNLNHIKVVSKFGNKLKYLTCIKRCFHTVIRTIDIMDGQMAGTFYNNYDINNRPKLREMSHFFSRTFRNIVGK